MGITQIITPFYRKLDSKTFRTSLETGQIAWPPVPYTWAIPQIMEVERESPEEHFASKFKIEQMSGRHFKKRQKLPIKLLQLEETEELVVSRCKCRPVLLIVPSHTKHPDLSGTLKKMGKSHLEDEFVAVIPLYHVQTEDTETGFPEILISRVKALMYNQFFFCIQQESGLPFNSIARLDRLFFVRPISPTVEPTDAALAEEAVVALLNLLRLSLALSIDEKDFQDFQALRQLALETLPESARRPAR